MSVLYDNTIRPRLQTMREHSSRDLRANLVIDIAESPLDIAHRFAELDVSSFPEEQQEEAQARRSRAQELVRHLSREGEAYWIDFTRQTSSTKTKLTRAGIEPGARIMLHGYLSTILVMHILRNVDLPERLRDEGSFLDLAGRKKVDETDSAAPSPTNAGGADGARFEDGTSEPSQPARLPPDVNGEAPATLNGRLNDVVSVAKGEEPRGAGAAKDKVMS